MPEEDRSQRPVPVTVAGVLVAAPLLHGIISTLVRTASLFD